MPVTCRTIAILGSTLLASGLMFAQLRAAEPAPITLENVGKLTPNKPDEAVAKEFSPAKAAEFLDTAALVWQKSFKCMTCHTNYMYLMARPSLGTDNEAHRTVRAYAEHYVAEEWDKNGPRTDTDVVMTALVLSYNDRETTGKLSPLAHKALDRIWTVQAEDGSFDWMKCAWPPMESDDYFGATMAALATSLAPEDYADTAAAKAGLDKLRKYFAANPPPTLHHRAMMLWADSYRPGLLLAEADRKALVDQLLALQHEDGGWSASSLGDWEREDGTPQDVATSDGYGTGLVIYLARRAEIPVSDARLVRGVAWLKANQRTSGRWFTRSLFKDNRHFLTHAGTAMAVMALGACDAIEPVQTAAK